MNRSVRQFLLERLEDERSRRVIFVTPPTRRTNRSRRCLRCRQVADPISHQLYWRRSVETEPALWPAGTLVICGRYFALPVRWLFLEGRAMPTEEGADHDQHSSR